MDRICFTWEKIPCFLRPVFRMVFVCMKQKKKNKKKKKKNELNKIIFLVKKAKHLLDIWPLKF